MRFDVEIAVRIKFFGKKKGFGFPNKKSFVWGGGGVKNNILNGGEKIFLGGKKPLADLGAVDI